MGTLVYGSAQSTYTINDRALAHLQIVIFTKLRHGEHFMFAGQSSEDGRPTSLWMAPGIPLRIEVHDLAGITINRDWVVSLAQAAYTAEGLHLVDEPGAMNKRPLPRRDRQLTS